LGVRRLDRRVACLKVGITPWWQGDKMALTSGLKRSLISKKNLGFGEGSTVTVDISVNWRFIGEGEDLVLSYSTGHVERPVTEELGEDVPTDGDGDFPFLGSVLPLQSSVLAPGLSMPVSER
jgi:hypothetical protein